MSKSTFTILKQCENCGEMFEAQKRTTRFCSHKCSARNYKLRKKLEAKNKIETETLKQVSNNRYKAKAVSLELIKTKDFITVRELSVLLGCGKDTIYRMIKSNEIKAVNLNKKLTRIRRKDVEVLFENTAKAEIKKPLVIEDCYSVVQIVNKYNLSSVSIYSLASKNNIRKIRKGKFAYYSKVDIDNLFKI